MIKIKLKIQFLLVLMGQMGLMRLMGLMAPRMMF